MTHSPFQRARVMQLSDDDSIFNVTEAHLDTGLRGIPVGTCQTSYVDPLEGVHYVGYPVADLVDLEEEDVIYLLSLIHI